MDKADGLHIHHKVPLQCKDFCLAKSLQFQHYSIEHSSDERSATCHRCTGIPSLSCRVRRGYCHKYYITFFQEIGYLVWLSILSLRTYTDEIINNSFKRGITITSFFVFVHLLNLLKVEVILFFSDSWVFFKIITYYILWVSYLLSTNSSCDVFYCCSLSRYIFLIKVTSRFKEQIYYGYSTGTVCVTYCND